MTPGFTTPRLTLRPLGPEDAADILTFERDNRAFFAPIIGDRGDRFFAEYPRIHADLLAEMERGESLLYLVRDGQGKLVGRVNFTRLVPGPASLGYRFTEAVAGQGYATTAVAQALAQATQAGVREVRAVVAADNPASRRVLDKIGFRPLSAGPDVTFVERNGRSIPVESYGLTLTGQT